MRLRNGTSCDAGLISAYGAERGPIVGGDSVIARPTFPRPNFNLENKTTSSLQYHGNPTMQVCHQTERSKTAETNMDHAMPHLNSRLTTHGAEDCLEYCTLHIWDLLHTRFDCVGPSRALSTHMRHGGDSHFWLLLSLKHGPTLSGRETVLQTRLAVTQAISASTTQPPKPLNLPCGSSEK